MAEFVLKIHSISVMKIKIDNQARAAIAVIERANSIASKILLRYQNLFVVIIFYE